MVLPSLCLEVYRQYGAGEIPASCAGALAKAAWDDGWGWAHADLLVALRDAESKEEALALVAMAWDAGRWGMSAEAKDLASVGTSGAHSGNAQRDLMRRFDRTGLVKAMPELYYFDARGKGGIATKHAMFLPHETIHMAVASVGIHSLVALPNNGPLTQLVRDWCAHPDVGLVGRENEVAPIGMAGDGMQYTSTLQAGHVKSVMLMNMNFIGGTVDWQACMYLITVLSKDSLCDCGCEGWHTINDVMKVLSWSFALMRGGESPASRHDGSSWSKHDKSHRMPAGMRLPLAALIQLRGDWDWMSWAYRFPRSNQEHFCWMCDIALAQYRAEFYRGAPHRATVRTHQQFLETVVGAGLEPSAIFGTPGTELRHCVVDEMHALFEGPCVDAIAGILHVEISNKRWHASRAAGLEAVNTELGLFYSANPHLGSFAPIRPSQLRSASTPYPTFKGKAATIKRMSSFCLALAHKHAGHLDREAFFFRPTHRCYGHAAEYCDLVVSCFEGLRAYIEASDSLPLDIDACADGMYLFLGSLEQLHQLWCVGLLTDDEKGKQPFHVRPKCHMCGHIVDDQLALWGNPRNSSSFKDESFYGGMKHVCGASKHPHTLEVTVMQKVRVYAACVAELWRRGQ